MKENRILLFAIFTIFSLLGCKEKNRCQIKIIDSQSIDNTTMYAVYTSDTCWDEMLAFSDSLEHNNKTSSNYNMVIFMYPEKSVPKFVHNSFAVEGGDFNNLYKIMEVFDSSQKAPPHHIVKYPDRYIEAKNKELNK